MKTIQVIRIEREADGWGIFRGNFEDSNRRLRVVRRQIQDAHVYMSTPFYDVRLSDSEGMTSEFLDLNLGGGLR